MAKKRRLKKPIRHALIKAYRFTKALTVSSVIGYGVSYLAVPVQANYSPKEVTKAIATLKSKDLTDAKTLKETVIETYNAENETNLTIDEARVVMSYPAVVTSPTIENATFRVEEKTDELNQEITIVEGKETEKDEATKVEDSADNTSSDIEESITIPEETPDTTVGPTENPDVEEVAEPSVDQVKTDTTVNIDLDEIDTVDDVSTDSKDAVQLKVEALNVASQLQSTTTQTTDIKLTTTDVTLALYTRFDANDYIASVSAIDNPFPVYKTSGEVDTSKEGTYKLVYTVIDGTGTSDSETLTVNVVKNDEQLEAERLEKVKNATDEFIELTNGQAWDMDGAYGDQCWDLWAKYVISEGLEFDYGCAPDGYADYVYKKYGWSGADKYFAKISKDEIQAGDWLFWNKGSSYPDSHVALLVKDYGNGKGLCLTQSRGQGTRLLDLNLDVLGGFRRIS